MARFRLKWVRMFGGMVFNMSGLTENVSTDSVFTTDCTLNLLWGDGRVPGSRLVGPSGIPDNPQVIAEGMVAATSCVAGSVCAECGVTLVVVVVMAVVVVVVVVVPVSVC